MNILITGSDGFIGSHLKASLESEGHRIFGTVFFKNPGGTNEIKLDLTLRDDFARLPKINFDVVIHAAGSIDQNLKSKRLMEINAHGTKRLLNWLKLNGCSHFIQISSVSVYGFKTLGQNRSEESTKRYEGIFALPYMKSKALAEKHIEGSGINYTILRLPAVLGENDSYISSSIIGPLKNGSFFTSGNADKLVSIICIRNLGKIIEKLIRLGPQNDFFNCSDFHINWNEFIEEYAKGLNIRLAPKRKSLLSVLANFRDKKFCLLLTFSRFGSHFPNDKLKSLINFEPKIGWKDAVKEAIKSLHEGAVP